jgi:HK97 family phage portal protein
MMPGSLRGLDPISFQRILWGEAADLAQYGANYFRNGSNQSGVISVPGPGSRRRAREVRDMWEASHSGVFNAHRPAVLFGGAQWLPMSITNENAQWLGTRAFLREEICGWFGVPLSRLQISQEKGSQGGAQGMSTKNVEYAENTLLPFATAVEDLWDTFIPGGQRTWTMFNMNTIMRADPETRARVAQTHRLIKVRNSNEIRSEEGWEPYSGGEDYDQPFATAASMNSSTGTGGDGGDGSANIGGNKSGGNI